LVKAIFQVKVLDNSQINAKRKQMLRARISVDQEFIPKVMCCIDYQLFQWLAECRLADCVDATTTTFKDFGSIFSEIQLSRFIYSLPVTVKKLTTSKSQNQDNKSQTKRLRYDNDFMNHVVDRRLQDKSAQSIENVTKSNNGN